MVLVRDLIELRRKLHQIPELAWEERETSRVLRAFVEPWADVRAIAGTGLVVDLVAAGGVPPSRTVLLRADMDALPVQEETGHAWASRHPGRMHACGHDGHMAALAVAGRRLAMKVPPGLRVRLLFQPSEEGGGGALRCIEEGVLEGVDYAFGVHIWNELPVGEVALTAGGIMAGVVELGLEIVGRGGHGAMPHQAADPVVAAAELVLALQTIVSRRVAPVEPAVVTIGAIHGGDAFNVIPERVSLRGTVRAFSEGALGAIEAAVREIAAGVARASGTQIEVAWKVSTRPTVNDARAASIAKDAVHRAVPELNSVRTDYRTMAGEDFGEILRVVPGCFALIGGRNEARGCVAPHHAPQFDFDETALEHAAAFHAAVVEELAGRP